MPASPVARVRVGVETPEASGGVPVVRVHGEADDHLRIVTLLAHEFRDSDPEAASACMRPKSDWSERLGHFRALVGTAHDRRTPVACIVDLDALVPLSPDAADAAGDDHDFRRERGQLFNLLLETTLKGCWYVVRPSPRADVTEKLASAGLGVSVEEKPFPEETDRWQVRLRVAESKLAPVVSPVLRWLMDARGLDTRAAVRMLEAAGDEPTETVLEEAYDALSAGLRAQARRLSLLREPADEHERRVVEVFGRQTIDTFLAAGILQPSGSGGPGARFVMPGRVRKFFYRRAVRHEASLDGLHRLLGERTTAAPTSVAVEVHHHAVQGGSLEDAIRTALYYGGDLRTLGRRLSKAEKFDQAARVFRTILEQFEPNSAYAWEYFAFNLARASGRAVSPGDRETISNAYARAHDIEPNNLLYHGRLVGFRAEVGEPVGSEVNRALATYRQMFPTGTMLQRFATPVLWGLRRGGRGSEADALKALWGADVEFVPSDAASE
jgi:tetratricopeptide (TPR) repeat protein